MPGAATHTRTITLRLTRHFDVPREQVFDAWTRPEALKRWWCPPGWRAERIDVDLRPGGAYCFAMRTADSPSVTVSIEGRFVDVRRPERLTYTWKWRDAFDGMPETFVTVEFHAGISGTDLVVTHENFPDVQAWHKHRAGWIEACDRMERTLINQLRDRTSRS